MVLVDKCHLSKEVGAYCYPVGAVLCRGKYDISRTHCPWVKVNLPLPVFLPFLLKPVSKELGLSQFIRRDQVFEGNEESLDILPHLAVVVIGEGEWNRI